MFYSLTGTLINVEETNIAVECCGVGYLCNISTGTFNKLPAIGSQIKIFTHLNVKEDSMELFGFLEKEELEYFKILTSVSGVGPRVGLAILSALSPEEIKFSIVSNNTGILTRANGVGNKLACRIILELKDKIENLQTNSLNLNSGHNINFKETISALTALGYSPKEANAAVGQIKEELSVEETIRKCLKILSRGK